MKSTESTEKKWHSNGQLKFETRYKSGKKDGKEKKWHSNGQLKFETLYKSGKKDGEERKWDNNGELISIARYTKGKKHYQYNYSYYDLDQEIYFKNGEISEINLYSTIDFNEDEEDRRELLVKKIIYKKGKKFKSMRWKLDLKKNYGEPWGIEDRFSILDWTQEDEENFKVSPFYNGPYQDRERLYKDGKLVYEIEIYFDYEISDFRYSESNSIDGGWENKIYYLRDDLYRDLILDRVYKFGTNMSEHSLQRWDWTKLYSLSPDLYFNHKEDEIKTIDIRELKGDFVRSHYFSKNESQEVEVKDGLTIKTIFEKGDTIKKIYSYPDGEIKSIEHYRNDELVVEELFDFSGLKIAENHYKKDKLTSYVDFDEEGNKILEIDYDEKGKKIREVKYKIKK